MLHGPDQQLPWAIKAKARPCNSCPKSIRHAVLSGQPARLFQAWQPAVDVHQPNYRHSSCPRYASSGYIALITEVSIPICNCKGCLTQGMPMPCASEYSLSRRLCLTQGAFSVHLYCNSPATSSMLRNGLWLLCQPPIWAS